MPRSVQALSELLSELPGVGPRHARRIVQFLLRSSPRYLRALADAIASVQEDVHQCTRCFRFDEINGDGLCSLCADATRDHTMLLVVEKDVDIDGIENAGIFRGRYFVLGSLMPLGVKRKTRTPARTQELMRLLSKEKEVREVVLAFATTPEGDYTAQELKKRLAEHDALLAISMLGRGLSLGAEIEYADGETLRNAFEGRH